MVTPLTIDVSLHVGGHFQSLSGKSVYVGGVHVLLTGISSNSLSYCLLVNEAKKVVGQNVSVFIWYKKPGLAMNVGRTIILGDRDMPAVLKTRDKDNKLDLYVTTRVIPFSSPGKSNPNLGHKKPTSSPKKPNYTKPTSSRGLEKDIPLDIPALQVIHPTPEKLPFRRQQRVGGFFGLSDNLGGSVGGEQQSVGSVGGEQQGGSSVFVEDLVGGSVFGKDQVDGSATVGGGFVVEKGKKNVSEKVKGKSKVVGKRNLVGNRKEVSKDKGRKTKSGKRKQLVEEEGEEDSDLLDSDIEVVEEDLVADDLFQRNEEGGKKKVSFLEDLEEEHNLSDDLRSLEGSEDEGVDNKVFNPNTDFKKKLHLEVGLKFCSVEVLRVALRAHAIENRYEYYFLHNGKNIVRAYCKQKCKCPWDKVRSKIRCVCQQFLCPFTLYATTTTTTKEYMEIRTLNLTHTCSFKGVNSKVSSEYLAEKYLEDWRENPNWELSSFVRDVYRTLGVKISYHQAWLTRARARLIINGDGADEYGRVWEYAHALRKYNPGSTVIVLVDNVENPPPQFQRMYVCLKACKVGFLAGCRPLIGVDGCHLKGPYPGMCLVAVSMDANNNIYPVAWAAVEVENNQT
ncbi:uncharacterized protein LOC141607385 [Silene latifolia]|uniref:uncharacterized protein LOC141607385 n=1 Tax=Silene latifolia TaxID=37657 RepID=UPI003D776B5E